jgi:hypothetical protein
MLEFVRILELRIHQWILDISAGLPLVREELADQFPPFTESDRIHAGHRIRQGNEVLCDLVEFRNSRAEVWYCP